MLTQITNITSAAPVHHHADPRVSLLRGIWTKLQSSLRLLQFDQSVDGVHEVRANARRLRALLRCMRKEMQPLLCAQLQFDLTGLSRDLADVRNADTQLRWLRELSSATRHLKTQDMLTTITLGERRSVAARRSLLQRMSKPVWNARSARIEHALSDPELLLRPDRLARDIFGSLFRTELKHTARALRGRQSSDRSLHKQRIRVKNARYVLEELRPQVQYDAASELQKLNRAQDVLGDVHDLQLLTTWLQHTPIPHTLQRPLFARIRKTEDKFKAAFRRFRPKLRKHVRKAARNFDRAVSQAEA